MQDHLETAPVLTENQRVRYRELRGYAAAPSAGSTSGAEHGEHAGH